MFMLSVTSTISNLYYHAIGDVFGAILIWCLFLWFLIRDRGK